MAPLNRSDLTRAIDDPRRLGTVGYNEGDGRSQRLHARAARIVLHEANAQGWSYDDLVLWVDSKLARWFWDSLYGCTDETGAASMVTIDDSLRAEGGYVYRSAR